MWDMGEKMIDPLDKEIHETKDIEKLRELVIVRTECLTEERAKVAILRKVIIELANAKLEEE